MLWKSPHGNIISAIVALLARKREIKCLAGVQYEQGITCKLKVQLFFISLRPARIVMLKQIAQSSVYHVYVKNWRQCSSYLTTVVNCCIYTIHKHL